MPRLSAEARATLTAMEVGKLRPSAHLTATEKRAWRQLVDATPAGHLSERDRPLVESYVVLSVAQRKVAALVSAADGAVLLSDPALARLESIAKTMAALSNRLKIAPLAGKPDAHKAGQRAERPAVPRLLGGLARVK